MAYQKQSFIDGVTVLQADHLKHIEDGIVANESAIGKKQETLVSGQNIKTVGGQTVMGSGNIPVKTIGGQSVFGSGDIPISSGGNVKCMIPQPLAENFYNGKTIACIGDSITQGVGASNTAHRYASVLAGLLGATEINLGVSGTVLCTGGHRTCNIDNLTSGKISGADVVTIMMGVNDWDQAVKNGMFGGSQVYPANSTYYALGTLGSDDTTTIYGALKMWCERVKEIRETPGFEKTKFFFVTPIITSWNNSVTSAQDFNQDKTNVHGFKFRDICKAIIETCAMYYIPVLDMNKFSGIYYNGEDDKTTNLYFGDGIHPNDAGHQKIAEGLYKYLIQNPAYVSEEKTVNYLLNKYSQENQLTYPDLPESVVVTPPVVEKTLQSISVTTQPSKTKYTEGETFSTSGMVVMAHYSDGSSEAVSGYTYTPSGALTTSNNQITVTYQGKTATVSITVKSSGGGNDPVAGTFTLGSDARYDEETGKVYGVGDYASLLTSYGKSAAIYTAPIKAGMEIEVEYASQSGVLYAQDNRTGWAITLIGLTRATELSSVPTCFNGAILTGDLNVYIDDPYTIATDQGGDNVQNVPQYLEPCPNLNKLEWVDSLTMGQDKFIVKFKRDGSGTVTINFNGKDLYSAQISALSSVVAANGAENLYLVIEGLSANTYCKVNYVGPARS